MNIRILLVDDHDAARAGLALLLRQESGIEIVGEASDGQMAVELADRLQPDVIIMDVFLPRLNGIQATRQIAADHPEIKIVAYTISRDASISDAVRQAGALACLSKSDPVEVIIRTIRQCSTPDA